MVDIPQKLQESNSRIIKIRRPLMAPPKIPLDKIQNFNRLKSSRSAYCINFSKYLEGGGGGLGCPLDPSYTRKEPNSSHIIPCKLPRGFQLFFLWSTIENCWSTKVWSRSLHWSAKRRKGEGGNPLPQVGVRGSPPGNFWKIDSKWCILVHFEAVNANFKTENLYEKKMCLYT